MIFTGIQASGKTTFREMNFPELVHINLDTLRTRNREDRLLDECVEQGRPFVVDNTDPTRESRRKYIGKAKAHGYRVIGYYFRSSIAECLGRNRERTGKARVPDAAIFSTHGRLELPSYEEGFDELYYVRIGADGFVTDKWDEKR